jgi:3D (Asp-Asp-Asp) domain-containing protein
VIRILLLCVLVRFASAVDPTEPALPAGHWVTAEITAYCPCRECCGPDANGTTSIGVHVAQHPYGLAADPAVVPYGTRVWIPTGSGILDHARPDERFFPVDDTGSRVCSEGREQGVVRLDVRVISHAYALRIGRQRVRVYLCDPPELQPAIELDPEDALAQRATGFSVSATR